MEDVKFGDLVGKKLKEITVGFDEITFTTNNGEQYRLFHSQDCCESVVVEDIIGDITDLLDSPIIKASEDTSIENPEGINKEYQDSFTWTFYNIATQNGHVTIRWYGESNGYYSEGVDFRRVR
jgi:hypothetical protein